MLTYVAGARKQYIFLATGKYFDDTFFHNFCPVTCAMATTTSTTASTTTATTTVTTTSTKSSATSTVTNSMISAEPSSSTVSVLNQSQHHHLYQKQVLQI